MTASPVPASASSARWIWLLDDLSRVLRCPLLKGGHLTSAREERVAVRRCEQEARDRAHRADSVDFSRILDLGFNSRPNGESTVVSTFTAENAFGVENKFDIRCDFSGERLIDVSISRAR